MGNTAVATDESMKGKTVLFTGASRGMGRIAAIELARRGAEILIVGHNEERGAAAVEAIRGAGGAATFLRADMGDGIAVLGLADAVLARSRSIDVLIHSAGGFAPAAARTPDGIDRGFAQNFLGAFLLTRLLEDRLLASAPARVIAVGSAAHRLLKRVDLDAFFHPTDAPPMTRSQKGSYQMRSYQTAKFAVTTWVYGLARRWEGRGVTANVLDPGLVKNQMGEQYEGPVLLNWMISRIIPLFVAASMERGSEQYVRLATDPTLVSVTGRYFVSGKENMKKSSALSLEPDNQKRVDQLAEAWASPLLRATKIADCPCCEPQPSQPSTGKTP